MSSVEPKIDPARVAAVVLAGGAGQRIRHLLNGLPKPMAVAAGRPFVEWILRYLRGQGIGRAVLSVGYRAEVIEEYFGGQPVAGLEIRFARETEPLGTAGGFLHATAALAAEARPEWWLVLNGDSLAVVDLGEGLDALAKTESEAAVFGVAMADAGRYGTLVCGADGRLERFVEKRPGAGMINAGIYLFHDSLLARFSDRRPLSFETDVFPSLLTGGQRVQVIRTEADFLDIGTPETLPQAEHFIQRHTTAFGAVNN